MPLFSPDFQVFSEKNGFQGKMPQFSPDYEVTFKKKVFTIPQADFSVCS